MEFIQIEVAQREALGSANANRIRREGGIPAELYGLGRPNLSLVIDRGEMERFLRTGSHLVELKLGDKARPAIVREIQVEPTTDAILHVDFNRVDADTEVQTDVPVQWKGRAGGESEGGIFVSLKDVVTVSARPRDLPRQYIFDIRTLGLNESVTIADLEARSGVIFVEPADTVLAQCTTPRVVEEEPAEEAEGAEGAEAPAEAAADGGEASGDKPADAE